MECRKGQKRLLAVKVAVLVGLAAGVASAATMTQLVNGPSDIRVAPLVQASWAQGDVNGSPCYNSKTPNNYVCGCVATAAGQIMRKWQYPAAAPARVTNGDCKIDGTTTSQTMRGGPDVPYEWTNMPLAPAVDGESLSAAQREAIGTLLYDIGVATGMNWRNDGASTSTSILAGQFTSTFGYANAAIAGNPSGTGLSLEQFKQAVLPCLDAGMPVVVGIGGANTSHSVVCDGYGYQDGDLYIHLNMGNAVDSDSSADYNNTWYKFPTNNPEGNDVSLWSGGEQSYLNPVVYNISPTMQKGWSIVSGRILSGGNAVEGAEVVAVNASGEGVATAASNAKGIYALALPAGTYTLRAVDSDETKGARVSVTVVATEGAARSDGGAENVVIGNQHGVDISLAEIGSDFLADETPDAYIDYVESSGSQYIDTGVIGKSGTKVRICIEPTATTESYFLASRSGDERFLFYYVYNGKFNVGYRDMYYAQHFGAATVGARYDLTAEIVQDGSAINVACTENGTAKTATKTQWTTGALNTGLNMYMFALNYNGSVYNRSKTKCYSTKIWQTDESGAYKLVRDFVPCKKGGRAALYDKVTRTIFYSRSGTDLIASDCTISTVGQPDEFLDYVESDGNQYIDTGVEGCRGVKAMMDVAWTGFVDETYQEILGAASSDLGAASSEWRCNLCDLYGAMPNYSYGENWGTFNSGLTSGRTVDTVYHVITEAAAKEVLTINGYTGVRNTASEVSENFTTGLNLYLFARNYNGSGDLNAKARLYYAKIWLDGVLVRDYVPCKKNGEPGLYDKVTKSIFVSKGSKPLIAGPVSSVVEEPDEFLDYVESNGNQYVDTGVRGRAGTKADMNFMVLEAKESWFMGSRKGSSGDYRLFFCYFENATYMDVGYGNEWDVTYWQNYSTTKPYSLQVEFTSDGVVKAARDSVAASDKTGQQGTIIDTECNLYLFACNVSGTATKPASARCYGTKIWQTDDNGEYRLLRDFVPCRKGGEPGLYDKVTKSIFYSRGTQPFIAGSLPGYPDEILDYVESTGAQYVDSGIIGKYGLKTVARYSWIEKPSSGTRIMLGSAAGSANNSGNCEPICTYNTYLYYIYESRYGYYSGVSSTSSYIPINTILKQTNVMTNKMYLSISGGTQQGTDITRTDVDDVASTFATGQPMYIFASNRGGTASYHAKGRIYSLQIYELEGDDWKLVCDFVPCKKDCVAGLWDRVTKKIFYSKTSTALVAGNTVAKVGTPDSFVEYVESSGTQYIDTGVIGKYGLRFRGKVNVNAGQTSSTYVLIGSERGDKDRMCPFMIYKTYLNYYYYTDNYFSISSSAPYYSDQKDLTFDCKCTDRQYLSLSGHTSMLIDATRNDAQILDSKFTTDRNMYLFAKNNNGVPVHHMGAKLYNLTIGTLLGEAWEDIRCFTPCVKGGKAALYDSVTGMIYYPQGGDLTASANEASVTSAQWVGGTVTSAADLANAANWKCWQAGLVVYGKAPVTVSEGVATLTCPVTLDVAADWSATGVITLASGATVDLNGHVLATAGFAVAEGATDSVLKNLPKGWKVKKSTDGRTLTIVKIKGVMIIAK